MTRWSRRPSTDEQLNPQLSIPSLPEKLFSMNSSHGLCFSKYCRSPMYQIDRLQFTSQVCHHIFWLISYRLSSFFCSFTEQTFSAFTIKIGYVWQVTINKNTWSWPKLLAIKMHKLLEPFFLYPCDFVWNKLLFGFKFITDLSDYLTWVFFFYRGKKKNNSKSTSWILLSKL